MADNKSRRKKKSAYYVNLIEYLPKGSKNYLTREGEVELAKRIANNDRAEEAIAEFVEANLHFAIHLASKRNSAAYGQMDIADLFQEACIGLTKAAKRFDYQKGYRFHTYAQWWIRQNIGRAEADKNRMIRLPVYQIETIIKLNKAAKIIASDLGYEPSHKDLADILEIEEKKISELYEISRAPVSLEQPLDKSSDDGPTYMNLVENSKTHNLESMLEEKQTESILQKILKTLTPRENKVIKMRFGL